MKVEKIPDDGLRFFCPACKKLHTVCVAVGGWAFNNDYDRPTLTPSVRAQWTYYGRDNNGDPIPETIKEMICHSFVTDGRIEYLHDCTHELASQTLDLPHL